jgi:hypothetical protein
MQALMRTIGAPVVPRRVGDRCRHLQCRQAGGCVRGLWACVAHMPLLRTVSLCAWLWLEGWWWWRCAGGPSQLLTIPLYY